MTDGKISTLTSHQEIQTKTRWHFSTIKLSKIKIFYEHSVLLTRLLQKVIYKHVLNVYILLPSTSTTGR